MTDTAPTAVRLYGWRDRRVVGSALIALVAGFGQFGVVAALGDVARSFGHHVAGGGTVAEQAGLSGTSLGIGLAVVRLASLASLVATGMGDPFGRRRLMVGTCATGLALTLVAAGSPSYWAFIVIFALGRPFLSAAATLAQVMAAEQTSTTDRTRAVALIAAGYAIGAGLVALVHSLASDILGFRGIFALAIVALAALPIIARWVTESDRFVRAAADPDTHPPVLRAVAPAFRSRLVIVAVLAFALSVITGPANGLLFLYAQNVVRLGGVTTAAMVLAAGLAGLAGLTTGQWLADHIGRRPIGCVAMIGVALCGCLAYSGSQLALVAGYVLGLFAASTFAPAAGALVNEVFPTSVRASVAGWQVAAGVPGAATGLVSFGAIANVGDRFGLAAAVTFIPAAAATVLFWLLPETKGREPEDLWPGSA
jgi:MFS family permease